MDQKGETETLTYYSVDRRGVYVDGGKIELAPNLVVNSDEIFAHINKKFPEGYSRHGMQWFRDPPPDNRPEDFRDSALLELLLEAMRKAYYPDKPSRYQSVFASVSLAEAFAFRSRHGKAADPVYELNPLGKVHRGDMAAIPNVNLSSAVMDLLLHRYWRGEPGNIPGQAPNWEYVLELPVAVCNKVI
jgi:hypothetical protein